MQIAGFLMTRLNYILATHVSLIKTKLTVAGLRSMRRQRLTKRQRLYEWSNVKVFIQLINQCDVIVCVAGQYEESQISPLRTVDIQSYSNKQTSILLLPDLSTRVKSEMSKMLLNEIYADRQ